MSGQLISVAQAEKIINEHMPAWPSEAVEIREAAGRILAEPIAADRDQPPFHRVMMDGIALSFEAWENGNRTFQIAGVHAAGQPAPVLPSEDHCWEVMTGAVLPNGCHCVVPVEQIQIADDVAAVDSEVDMRRWTFVHRQGTDYREGTSLLSVGEVLRSPELAVLSSVGCADVRVARQPQICVVSTGDELVQPDQAVAAHQIRSANDFAIGAALRVHHLGQVHSLHLRDDRDGMRSALERAIAENDALVLSGGVSMGKFDYLPEVLGDLGVQRLLHKVAQRPGKPMWFGVTPDQKPVFALPGNPVSALICFHRLALPALRRAMGQESTQQQATLATDFSINPKLTHFVPVDFTSGDGGQAVVVPRQLNTSGDFFGMAGSAGFIQLNAGDSHWSAGQVVPYFPW